MQPLFFGLSEKFPGKFPLFILFFNLCTRSQDLLFDISPEITQEISIISEIISSSSLITSPQVLKYPFSGISARFCLLIHSGTASVSFLRILPDVSPGNLRKFFRRYLLKYVQRLLLELLLYVCPQFL